MMIRESLSVWIFLALNNFHTNLEAFSDSSRRQHSHPSPARTKNIWHWYSASAAAHQTNGSAAAKQGLDCCLALRISLGNLFGANSHFFGELVKSQGGFIPCNSRKQWLQTIQDAASRGAERGSVTLQEMKLISSFFNSPSASPLTPLSFSCYPFARRGVRPHSVAHKNRGFQNLHPTNLIL